MARSGCSGPIFLVFRWGWSEGTFLSTAAALVPVIYNASTRAVVIDSMD
jgi:hypothetical protein